MSELEFESEVEEVQEALDEAEAQENVEFDVSAESISKHIKKYVDTRVDQEEAVRYTVSDILDQADIENKAGYLPNTGSTRNITGGVDETKTVEEITEINEWIEFTGVVIETYDTSVDAIAQQGRLADHTGSIRFTIWESSDVDHTFEVGETLNLQPVVTNKFNNEHEIKIEDVTSIEVLTGDDALDIDPDEFTEEEYGVVIDFQSKMGIIDRCPNEDCRRVLDQNDHCPDCGDVESELDLRTKAILDNGQEHWTIFLDEQLTGEVVKVKDDEGEIVPLTLEQAEKIAQEHSDRSVVRTIIEGNLHGEYINVTGRDRGNRFDVEDIDLITPPTIEDLETVKEQIEELA